MQIFIMSLDKRTMSWEQSNVQVKIKSFLKETTKITTWTK